MGNSISRAYKRLPQVKLLAGFRSAKSSDQVLSLLGKMARLKLAPFSISLLLKRKGSNSCIREVVETEFRTKGSAVLIRMIHAVVPHGRARTRVCFSIICRSRLNGNHMRWRKQRVLFEDPSSKSWRAGEKLFERCVGEGWEAILLDNSTAALSLIATRRRK